MKRKYKAIRGARFNDDAAEVIGRELEKFGDSCIAEMVIAEARKARSPLHRFFDWDDTSAAHQYRLDQARYYIRHVEVVLITPEGAKPTRGWHRVQLEIEDSSSGAYVQSCRIRKDRELSNQVIASAMRELHGWQRRYADYESVFGEVFVAVKKTEKRLARRKGRAKAAV
jgi:hypothetical protein